MSAATERITEFAQTNRLRLIDTGVQRIVPGKYGELADMGDVSRLRMRLIPPDRSADVDRTLRVAARPRKPGD